MGKRRVKRMQVEERRARVSALALAGVRPGEMARRLEVPAYVISKDLAVVEKEWQASACKSRALAKEVILGRHEMLWRRVCKAAGLDDDDGERPLDMGAVAQAGKILKEVAELLGLHLPDLKREGDHPPITKIVINCKGKEPEPEPERERVIIDQPPALPHRPPPPLAPGESPEDYVWEDTNGLEEEDTAPAATANGSAARNGRH